MATKSSGGVAGQPRNLPVRKADPPKTGPVKQPSPKPPNPIKVGPTQGPKQPNFLIGNTAGSYKKGGRVKKSGVAKLHKGEKYVAKKSGHKKASGK